MIPESRRAACVESRPGVALVLALVALLSLFWTIDAEAAAPNRPSGLPTSQAGLYLPASEWLFAPTLELIENKDYEYDPSSFGFPSPQEALSGRYKASELRLFAAYGVSERIGVEFEARGAKASLERATDDLSGMPDEVDESGLGMVRARLNWRWCAERERRPELFSYAEIVIPHDASKPLIGTADWVANAGLGAVKEFSWGAVTLRAGFEYDTGSATAVDFHEYALEYLKRLGPQHTLYLGYTVFEGDEAYLAAELHWSPRPNFDFRLGARKGVVSSALATSENSADWIGSFGVVFRRPAR